MALYDELTGLHNREMFQKEITKLIENKENNNKFAIVYMDIDNFKYINESLGHQAGDMFLKFIGENLLREIKQPNLVARLGGDEFVIIFNDIECKDLLLKKIETLRKNIDRTWCIYNYEFFISISIGIAIFPDNGNNINSLFKNAELAMYAAKKEGKDTVLFYKDIFQKNNLRHIELAYKLQTSIDNDEFVLFYQPQYNLLSEKIEGMEVLIRWKHPVEGFISPGEFIPLAEDTGQIYKLERIIFQKALQMKKKWEEQGFNNVSMSINLSSKTLTSDINFKELERLIKMYKVDYSKVTLEITETAIISNVDLVIERLNRLRERGLKIALDDFGTGYSSLTYLKKLPIDIIKLDRSFIKSISENKKDALIIKFLLLLANDLEYKVVAEGIETKEHLHILREYQCEYGQGFLLSEPLPEEKINILFEVL